MSTSVISKLYVYEWLLAERETHSFNTFLDAHSGTGTVLGTRDLLRTREIGFFSRTLVVVKGTNSENKQTRDQDYVM